MTMPGINWAGPFRDRLGGVVKLLWRVSNSRIFTIRAGAGYGIVC